MLEYCSHQKSENDTLKVAHDIAQRRIDSLKQIVECDLQRLSSGFNQPRKL